MSYFYKENHVLETKINRFFERLEAINKEKYEGALSVVLLGSLSRGEGTWITTQAGHFDLLSDIEFFTVCPTGFRDYDNFSACIQNIAHDVFDNSESKLFHIDNTFIFKNKIPKLERKLLTYDAARAGRCVVGEDVLSLFPQITIDNINFDDIEDILTHRVFSILYYGIPLKKSDDLVQYRYSVAKNSLDLMTVLLVSNGILECGFQKKYERIKLLDIDKKIKDYFGYCLDIKLKGEVEERYSVEKMEQLFDSLLDSCTNSFHRSFRNFIVNIKPITKRRLGILKRSIKHRHFVVSKQKHFYRLKKTFRTNQELTEGMLIDNLVLNGYPNRVNNE